MAARHSDTGIQMLPCYRVTAPTAPCEKVLWMLFSENRKKTGGNCNFFDFSGYYIYMGASRSPLPA